MSRTYEIEDLVTVAKRENNAIRPYLYVNPIQGKHIPTDPYNPLELFRHMAQMLDVQYAEERILIIGFAETATAIGAAIAGYAKSVKFCTHTTREKYDDAEYLYFTESHSHATEQSLIINDYDGVWNYIDRVIFVEDEVTTGNTICKLISVIREHFATRNVKFGILSILNSMSKERIKELSRRGIVCQYVKKIPFEYRKEIIENYHYFEAKKDSSGGHVICENNNLQCANLRRIQNKESYLESVRKYVQKLVKQIEIESTDRRILVLGTEEFMYPPLILADALKKIHLGIEVKFHATTRSPILVSEDSAYPLHSRWQIKSTYDPRRMTYIYNLSDYDLAIVLTDSDNVSEDSYGSIMEALIQAGCKRIYFAR